MAEGFDGKNLIKILKQYLPAGSTLLELGMGPGKDLDILKKHYKVTGSDNSQVFLDLYQKKHPDADIINLNAVTVETERRFDCIYSNKVLIHLTKNELEQSFQNQYTALKAGGFLFHSFWWGDKEEEMQGLRFIYYTDATLQDLIGDRFSVVASSRYKEMEENDSFYIVLRKNPLASDR